MRKKDYKRLIIHAQKAVRKAAKEGVVDLTGSIYPVDFSAQVTPEREEERADYHLDLLGQVAAYSRKAKRFDLAEEAEAIITSISKGGIKATK